MNTIRFLTCITFLAVCINQPHNLHGQDTKRICLHMTSQTLQSDKLITTEADQYFLFPEGRIISYFQTPEEYVFVSNILGESKIYRPKQNQLILRSAGIFTTKNNSLYYFLTNQTYDLGFKDLGMQVYDSEEDGDYLITRWQAPARMIHQVDKIELVHENLLPVYSKYTNTDGEVTLKVYFEDFSIVQGSQMPKRITEIIYLPQGDSIIKRTDFTRINFGSGCNQDKFNFTVPEDAVITK